MNDASSTHLVLIPSYNTGGKVLQTVFEARRVWNPVWVVVDGSTDGTLEALRSLERDDPGLRVLALPRNEGKGAAILHGLREAEAAGYTHALAMDADGQHPTNKIREFMARSAAHPDALILGLPVFDSSAPFERVHGRKLSNWFVHLETLYAGIGDSLYGFRVYPVSPLRDIMERRPWMRRYDFDAEAAVRLCWGGSHFSYLRDNALLGWMHLRLMTESLVRLPFLIGRRLAGRY
jgi:glycosyltransferase involved in cell wall biosynthesis